VVVVATDSPVLDKLISNMQEVRVPGAHVVAIATEDADLNEHAEDGVEVPAGDWMLRPLLAVIRSRSSRYRIASCAA
jgi:glucosamine--fructose-6-phosphate aminotransferase (isomerizing)